MSDNSTKVITPPVRLSYPNLFKPRSGPSGGDPKYSAALVYEEEVAEQYVQELKVAIMAAAKEKWGDKAAGMFKAGTLRNPLRHDWEQKGYPENSIYINCSSKTQPGLVGPYLDPVTGKPEIITDPAKFYPGCYVRASIRAFPYDVNGGRGVSFGLNNIQFVKDGTRFDSRVAAVDEFAEFAQEKPLADLPDSDASELDDILK